MHAPASAGPSAKREQAFSAHGERSVMLRFVLDELGREGSAATQRALSDRGEYEGAQSVRIVTSRATS